MADKALVTYDDFRGGDWGIVGPKRATKNQFHGLNVLVYEDGQLGPRAGIRDLITGSTASGSPIFFDSFDAVPGSLTGDVIFGATVGGTHYSYRWQTTVTGTLTDSQRLTNGIGGTPSTVRQQLYFSSDGQSFYRPMAAGIVKGNLATFPGTQSLVAGSPASDSCAIRYGDRLIVTINNRLFYSAPADFTTWPVANFIDIGESAATKIAGLYFVRGVLVIVMDDYSVWVLAGVPGVNEVLRQVLPRAGADILPGFQAPAADSERLATLWMTRLSGADQSRVALMTFGGSAAGRTYDDHPFRGYNPGSLAGPTVVALDRAGDVAAFGAYPYVAPSLPNLLLRYNGIWTRHQIEYPNTGYAVNAALVGSGRIAIWSRDLVSPMQHRLSSLQLLDIVPVYGDPYGLARIGDNSTTVPVPAGFDLSEFWSPAGEQLEVRHVVIEATVYPMGGGIHSGCSVYVKALSPDPSPAPTTRGVASMSTNVVSIDCDTTVDADGATLPVVEPLTHEGDDQYGGFRRTFRVSPETRTGTGFQIQIRNLVGMSIRRILVLGEMDPPR